ncbi:MAG: hypothetical protein ACRD24_06860 [Terriglobales bacterium]
MSEISALPVLHGAGAAGPVPRRLLAGVGLVTFGTLLLELACTRLFSVVLFYHFAFLAIGVALLGLGAGGVFAYLKRDWLARWSTNALAARICGFNVVAIVVALAVILRVPVSPELSLKNFASLSAVYLATGVPFFFTGLLLSLVFAREAGRISQLYGADLTGGALACLAVVPVLNLVGAINAIFLAGLVMGVAAVVWSETKSGRNVGLRMAVVMLGLMVLNRTGDLVEIKFVRAVDREQPRALFSKWNAISRVEVQEISRGLYIVIDADAQTAIMNQDVDTMRKPEWRSRVLGASSAMPNLLRPRGAFAIIGPGGGVDVLRALAAGSNNVSGIEINDIIVNTIMRDRYAEYSKHLYQRPDVHIHVNDGRSFIRHSSDRYDVVQMTLVDTWAATSAGAFALSENNLYTVEAFREYFEHLKPDGMIAVTRWEFRKPREALRVISQAMAALERLGVPDSTGHFLVVANAPLSEDGVPVTVLAKRSPFTAEEEALVRRHLAGYPRMAVLYSPSAPEKNAFTDLIRSGDPAGFAQNYPYNVAPVTDNDPFFFFTLKTSEVFRRMAEEQTAMDWRINLGVAVLVMLLAISTLAVLLFLVVPLALHRGARGQSAWRLLYFVAIGLGYILVEIAFVQRFVLFLGHPTYALTVVVFLMLLGSGAGSVTARRWLADPLRVRVALAVVVAATLLYLWLLPRMLTALVGLPFAVKLLLSATVLLPLGFVMGMPFPTGLRVLAGSGERTIEWAFAMNAGASVLGSVLAVTIAIHYGLGGTLAAGAAAYLVAALATSSWRPVAG